jgi:hypothetical protein
LGYIGFNEYNTGPTARRDKSRCLGEGTDAENKRPVLSQLLIHLAENNEYGLNKLNISFLVYRFEKMNITILEWENKKMVKAKRKLERKEVSL